MIYLVWLSFWALWIVRLYSISGWKCLTFNVKSSSLFWMHVVAMKRSLGSIVTPFVCSSAEILAARKTVSAVNGYVLSSFSPSRIFLLFSYILFL